MARINYDADAILSSAQEHVKVQEKKNIGEAVVKASNPMDEIKSTDYISEEEKETMKNIIETSETLKQKGKQIQITNEEMVILKASRCSVCIPSYELISHINKYFGSIFADYIGCEINLVPTNGTNLLQSCLVFSLNTEKLSKDDPRFHNLIEIGNNGKTGGNKIIQQAYNISAHMSGRYFKFNAATKAILEKFIPDNDDYYVYKNNMKVVEWEKHDKGIAKNNLTTERVQKLNQGNIMGQLTTAATMEYTIVVDLNKIVNNVVKLSDREDKDTCIFASFAAIIPNTVQMATGPAFDIRLEEINIPLDKAEQSRHGMSYVMRNNYYFGSNIR